MIYVISKIKGDGNCLYRKLRISTFVNNPIHLIVRQYLCDYMIQNRDRLRDFMIDSVEIDKYIFKMLRDDEWGVHAFTCSFIWIL